MLARALREERPAGRRVLDLCAGSGVLAVCAAMAGARQVVAVDVSRRAVLACRLNARLNGVRLQAIRGDLVAPLDGARFDLIVSNPPYLPSEDDRLPERGPRRAWEAGRDGRAVLDRICARAPAHLAGGGTMLLVHSSVCGVEETLARLVDAGLEAGVAARHRGPLGPLMAARAGRLEARGLLAPGQRDEEVVVISAVRARA
jgi:release factor glutamine methyltransferase